MTTRNRGNYSGYGDRRSGSMKLLRQGALLLSLGALSFLLGFFVLARVMPTGHGPDTPGGNAASPPVTMRDHVPAESGALRHVDAERPLIHAPSPAEAPSQSASLPGAPAPAGPSIEPADEGPTQAPASPDGSRSASGASESGGNVGTVGVAPGNSAAPTSASHGHRRRRSHRRHTPVETPAAAAPAPDVQPPARMDDGTQPAGEPDSSPKEGGNSQGDGNGGQ